MPEAQQPPTGTTFESLISAIVLIAFIVLVLWDATLVATGQTTSTISNVIRRANFSSGGLVALGIAALYVHLFVPLPWPTGTDSSTP